MRMHTKAPPEEIVYTFDFTNRLASGDSLIGTPVVTVSPASGLTLLGSPTITGSNTKVNQEVGGGADRTINVLSCRCNTLNGEVLIVQGGLAVRA